MEILRLQYTLNKSSRAVLFDYLETIQPLHYVQELPGFGHGSMQKLQLHIANTYVHWLGRFGLQQLIDYLENEEYNTLPQLREAFRLVDILVENFLAQFQGREFYEISRTLRNGQPLTITPLALFTHVFTHEFHHKGQILSMSRALGYTPVDTDVIRT